MGPFDPTSLEESIAQIQSGKQDKLISGTSIKTINGNSILGSGNLEIQGGNSGLTPEQVATMISEEVGAEEIAREQAYNALDSRIDTLDLRTGNMGAIASYDVQILTQSQYIALEEKNSHTFYFIIDEEPLDEEDNDE